MTTAASRLSRVLALALAGALVLVTAGTAGCMDGAPLDALVRVDQRGYAPGESKIAVLLAPRDAAGVRAFVVAARGQGGTEVEVGASRGAWNKNFRDVRPIDLSALTTPGMYRIRVEGRVNAESPPFRVAAAGELFRPLVADSVEYFRAHRDGADQVSGAWRRGPSHLADRAATVYDAPSFGSDGRLTGELSAVGGPVDVEGGWYDAGDFLKFTHTTAYAVIAMMLVERDGVSVDGLGAEARHGVDWLRKMWDPGPRTLYTQVGIGSGGTGFLGDHDTWRLPEGDDQLDVRAGDDRYYQRYRPVFRAAEPGAAISPNLAGRMAGALALAAQVETANDPGRARALLADAAQIFGLARTEDVGELVTAEPRAFYPEDSWTDDLAAGAVELALAGRALGDARADGWLRQATRWATANADEPGSGGLSVYDLSSLAQAELARVLARDDPDTAAGLRRAMQRRLDAGLTAAAANPMGAASGNGGADYAARQLGFTAAAELYEHTFQDGRYAPFATAQRGVVLGANGWGTSMVVGAGSTYPRCPHDQIATLAGSPAVGPGMVGAVVNGPNTADRVRRLLTEAGGTPGRCSTDDFARFDRDDAHYVDDSRVSANSEPAIDFTATGLLAFALIAQQH